MRARGIIAKGAAGWTPAQYATLQRAREAEAMGAFDILRDKLGTLRGYAVESPSKDGYRSLWLTEQGYRKFVFLLSQDAVAYFQSRGAQARFLFNIRSIDGKRLFHGSGRLTQDGIELYHRIRRKLPAFWKYPDGTVNGNVRPPPLEKPSADARTQAPARPEPESSGDDPQTLQAVAALMQSGYMEISQTELRDLIARHKLSEADLRKKGSLRILTTRAKVYYLLLSSDPLAAILTRRRSAPR